MTGENPVVHEALAVYAPEALETERVPPGYKLSEVGVIPENWRLAQLGDVSEIIMGQSPVGTSYNRSGSGVPLINGPTEFTEKHPVKIQWTTQPTKLCKSHDLLLCVRGSSTGRMNVANGEYCLGRGIAAIRAGMKSDTVYLTYQVELGIGRLLAMSAGSTFPNVDGKSIRSIEIPLPEVGEQRAIAAALSDVDALISALDKLISKKRAVKTAAMQQLLTGKQRLPGFGGEWEVKRLEDVCQIISGGTPSTSVPAFWTGAIPWCTPTDITANNAKYLFTTNRTISEEGLKHSSASLLPRGALLLCTRATIGEIKIAAEPVCTNQGFKSLVCSRDASNEFLFYKLVTLKEKLRELGVGSTFLEVSRKDIASLEVPMPKLEEQTAIAAMLSDMDAEIRALEGRREKTRRIKQGMMQELLTGRTRLV